MRIFIFCFGVDLAFSSFVYFPVPSPLSLDRKVWFTEDEFGGNNGFKCVKTADIRGFRDGARLTMSVILYDRKPLSTQHDNSALASRTSLSIEGFPIV